MCEKIQSGINQKHYSRSIRVVRSGQLKSDIGVEPRGTREIVIKIIFFGYILGVRSRQYCRYAKSPGYSSSDQGEYPGDLVYRQYCLLPAPQKYQKNSYHYQIKSVRVHLIKTGTDVWLQTYHSGDVSFRITKNSSKLYSFLLYVALTLFCFTEKEKRSSKLVGSISTALSCLSLGSLLPGEERGLLSRTAAGNRA